MKGLSTEDDVQSEITMNIDNESQGNIIAFRINTRI